MAQQQLNLSAMGSLFDLAAPALGLPPVGSAVAGILQPGRLSSMPAAARGAVPIRPKLPPAPPANLRSVTVGKGGDEGSNKTILMIAAVAAAFVGAKAMKII